MATIKEKLLIENEKDNKTIVLHQEGIFYIVYEHSAWLFYTFVHQFKTKKTFVKSVGKDVVSMGFPVSSLEKFIGLCKVFKEGSIVRMELVDCDTTDKMDFEQWKNQQGSERPQIYDSVTEKTSCNKELCDMIKAFPLESKTPVECMLFLVELKNKLK